MAAVETQASVSNDFRLSMQATQVSALVMQLADVLVVGLAGAVVQRSGRRPLGALVHSDGPPVLRVVIGTPQGRWHAEFTGVSLAARECRRLLLLVGATTVSDVAVGAPATFALAVLLDWCILCMAQMATNRLGP